MVTVGYLLVALVGPLVRLSTAPESVLLVIRMFIAAAIVAVLVARAGTFRQLIARRTLPYVLLFGALSASSVLLFFIALRGTNVAVATFLFFTSPIYVAVMAPRVLGEATSRIATAALLLALAGMAVIVVPGAVGASSVCSVWGLVAGAASGLLLGFYTLVLKHLTRTVDSVPLTFAELGLDAVFVLPLALVQLSLGAALPDGRDWLIAAVLGVVATALAYLLLIEGAGRIQVQHWAILSYLTPVAAPLLALLILDERPSPWTILGGALIVAAGFLVALFDTQPVAEPVPVAETEAPPAADSPARRED